MKPDPLDLDPGGGYALNPMTTLMSSGPLVSAWSTSSGSTSISFGCCRPGRPMVARRHHFSGSNRFTGGLQRDSWLGSFDDGHDDEGEDGNRKSPDNV